MPLPTDLRKAISATGGGKITLVVGAGCSLEPPTSIPLAADCAQQCHDRLVADGVLQVGDCQAPGDLSALADTIFAQKGSQRELVNQLAHHYPFRAASPNEGHLLATALLLEQAVVNIVTLNFDLALSNALAELGGGITVGIIEGPEDFQQQRTLNIYYLHGSITREPDSLVLRTESLQNEWRSGWEGVVAAKVLSTPVVIFAGLGSPVSVLIESTKLIRAAIPTGHQVFQVDPAPHGSSPFSTALQIDADKHLQKTWCSFMAALAQRYTEKVTQAIKLAADDLVQRNRLSREDIAPLLRRLHQIGLIELGRLRAAWLLDNNSYLRDDVATRELIADLLLAAALIQRVTGAVATLFGDGVVEFRRGSRVAAAVVFVSGRGTRSWVAVESELSARRRRHRGRATRPNAALVTALADRIVPINVPRDVLLGDVEDDIVLGPAAFPVHHVNLIREEPAKSSEVAP